VWIEALSGLVRDGDPEWVAGLRAQVAPAVRLTKRDPGECPDGHSEWVVWVDGRPAAAITTRLDQVARVAAPAQQALTPRQLEVLEFLYGAGPLDGHWFEPDRKPKFWWRSVLREAFGDTTAPAQQAAPSLTVGAEPVAWRRDMPASEAAQAAELEKAREDQRLLGTGVTVNGWHVPARLVSFQPHMHYRGKRQTLEAILPNGQVQLLTDVNRFVWTWQIAYPYKNEPALPAGTVLHMTAWHDNSAGNKENPDPTAFVGWGSRTVDEMNIGWLDFYYITDQEYTELQKANADKSRSTQLQQQ